VAHTKEYDNKSSGRKVKLTHDGLFTFMSANLTIDQMKEAVKNKLLIYLCNAKMQFCYKTTVTANSQNTNMRTDLSPKKEDGSCGKYWSQMECALSNIEIKRHTALNEIFLDKDVALILKTQNVEAGIPDILERNLPASLLKYAFGSAE